MKQPRRARTIRIPAAPNSFAVMLIADDELLEGGKIEMQLPTRAQRFDSFDEDKIRRAGTKTWKRRGRQDEKLSRFKMRSRLQPDRGEPRDGITATLWHLFHVLENQAVVIFRECGGGKCACTQCREDP